jgi:hypothetical protein
VLTFTEDTPNGYLCIPYREKSGNNTLYTTNIIIPFTVGKGEKGTTADADRKPSTKTQSASSIHGLPAVKRESGKIPIQTIIGCAAKVHSGRPSVQLDAKLNVKGRGERLTYTRDCPIEEDTPDEIVLDLSLKVFPNPAGGATSIQYHLPETQDVSIQILDLQGKTVHALLQKTEQHAGPHQLQWDTADLPSGMYLVRIQTSTDFTVEKIMVTRDVHR